MLRVTRYCHFRKRMYHGGIVGCTPLSYVLLPKHITQSVCHAGWTIRTMVRTIVKLTPGMQCTCMNTCTQHLPFSMLFMSSPSDFIVGLPRSLTISQTFTKASSSHVCSRHTYSIWFCCLASGFLVMIVTSRFPIMLSCTSSCTMALASIDWMNRLRKWPRTCLAAWNGRVTIYKLVDISHTL